MKALKAHRSTFSIVASILSYISPIFLLSIGFLYLMMSNMAYSNVAVATKSMHRSIQMSRAVTNCA